MIDRRLLAVHPPWSDFTRQIFLGRWNFSCGHFLQELLHHHQGQFLQSGCVMEMGTEHILFGVDWPFVSNPPTVQWMETVPLWDEDKAQILSGNAKRLLRM
jgi:hypothetical protein